jgi:hypothetical protein
MAGAKTLYRIEVKGRMVYVLRIHDDFELDRYPVDGRKVKQKPLPILPPQMRTKIKQCK